MAKYRRKYASQDEIPERLRDFYEQADDGSWVFDVDGPGEQDIAKLQQALKQEREHRTTATKRLGEYEEKYREIDPDAAKEALEKVNQLEEERLVAEKKFEELAERRWKNKVQQLEDQIKQAQAEMEKRDMVVGQWKTKYSELAITEQLKQEALAQGVDPKKLKFLLHEARQPWQLDDQDQPVPLERGENGEQRPLYGADPNRPMTMAEQIEMLTKENPWFLLPSGGGGTRNNAAGQTNGQQILLSRAQAKDIRTFERAMQRSEETGMPVVYTD